MRTFLWIILIIIAIVVMLFLGFIIFGVYIVAARLGMPTIEAVSAGFWQGLWQGLIAILSFITSLFDHSITIYQTGNNGGWYNLGYLLGISIPLGGCGIFSKK